MRSPKKGGVSFPVEVSARSTETLEGRLRIHIIRDITERKMNEAKIIRMANFDFLTGIANRASLLNQLDYALEFANRNNQKVALMLFDIDKFKSINDDYGHEIGDIVLRFVAENVKSVLRKVDVVGRLGGDEFVILQTNIINRDNVSILARKVVDALKKPVIYQDKEIFVSISIGISIYPDDTMDRKELLHLADKAMYEAKRKGGGSFLFSLAEGD